MKTISWTAIVLLLVIAGCNSSRITSSWKAGDAEVRKYDKILVLGLTRESDRSIQENMENHLVGDLKEFGYNAVSSLQEYGPKVFDKMDEEAAIEKLKDSGVDAVITIVLLDKKKKGGMFRHPILFSLWLLLQPFLGIPGSIFTKDLRDRILCY